MNIYNVSQLPELDVEHNKIFYLNKANTHYDDIEKFIYNSIQNSKLTTNKSDIFGFEIVKNRSYSSLELEENHKILCITYINSVKTPIYLTKINKDKYMYKKFKSENELFVNFPVNKNQLILKCESSLISNSNVDMIIIYKVSHINKDSDFYIPNKYNNNDYTFEYISSDKQKTINVNNVLSYEFFNKLLYERSDNINEIISQLTDYSQEYSTFCLIETRKYDNSYGFDSQLREQLANNTISNRFIQRYRSDKLIDEMVCDYIYELFKKKPINKEYENEIIDITEDVHASNIIKFILNIKIIPEIVKNYNIPSSYNISVDYLAVNTIVDTRHSDLYKIKNNNSPIFVDLMLTNRSGYEGSSHEFADGIKLYLKKGDIIAYWHNSIIKQRILEKGKISLLTLGIRLNSSNSLSETKSYVNLVKNPVIY